MPAPAPEPEPVFSVIAEGAGEHSPPEKRRFYRIARRSAAEALAALDVLRVIGVVDAVQIETARAQGNCHVGEACQGEAGHGLGLGLGHAEATMVIAHNLTTQNPEDPFVCRSNCDLSLRRPGGLNATRLGDRRSGFWSTARSIRRRIRAN